MREAEKEKMSKSDSRENSLGQNLGSRKRKKEPKWQPEGLRLIQ